MYTGLEFEMGAVTTKELIRFIEDSTGRRIREDSGISIKSISEQGSEHRSLRVRGGASSGRTKVTAGHKANIMKFSDGLFLEVARRLAGAYPDIAFEDRIIDALCMQLIQGPERFDVLVLPNLYGDVAAELLRRAGRGVGVAPGGHFGGRDGLELAVFEATHGTAPDLAGTNTANPVGAMLSGAMLLRHVGRSTPATDWTRRPPRCWPTVSSSPVTSALPATTGRPPARSSSPTRSSPRSRCAEWFKPAARAVDPVRMDLASCPYCRSVNHADIPRCA